MIFRKMCRMDAVLMGVQHSVLKPLCSGIFVHFPTTTIVLTHLSPPFHGWRVNKGTKWPIILTFHLCYSQKSLMVLKNNKTIHIFMPLEFTHSPLRGHLIRTTMSTENSIKIKSIVYRKTGKICLVVEVLPFRASRLRSWKHGSI